MRFSSVFAGVAMLAATAQASYMSYNSPKCGDSYSIGSENTISWDQSSIKGKGKMNAYLCKGGSVDISEVITQIALNIDNSGSYRWTPSESLDVSISETVVIIIEDSSKNYYNSDDFYMDHGHHSKGNDNTKTKTKDNGHHNTMTYHGYQNVTKTSVESTTETVTTTYKGYSTSMVTLDQSAVTTYLSPPSMQTYQVPPPIEATSVYQPAPIYTVSNTTYNTPPPPAQPAASGAAPEAVGTGAAPAAPQFTGAASAVQARTMSAVGVIALVAYLL